MQLGRSLKHLRLFGLSTASASAEQVTHVVEASCAPVAAFQSTRQAIPAVDRWPGLAAARFSTAAQDTERTGKSHYVDRLRVEIQAGRGGSGCVAFWKSAAKGEA